MNNKILVISQRFWPEEGNINTIVKGFSDRGIKVDVLCGQPNYPEGRFYKGYHASGHKKEQYGDVNVYRAPELARGSASPAALFFNYLSFALAAKGRIGALKRNQYDAIFIYQTSPAFQGMAGLKLARKKRIRSFMYVADLWPDAAYREMDIRDGLLKRIFKNVSFGQYRKAGQLIACSKEAQRYLIREVAQTPGQVAYVPAFSSTEYDKNARNEKLMERFAGSFNIIYSGEILRDGPWDIILDAAKMLVSAGLRDVRFIIAGGGNGLSSLKKEIDRRGLFDTVFPEGSIPLSRISEYVNIADALIYTEKLDVSVNYAPPMKIIEYLSYEKPIIAATGGDGRMIIKRSKCGFASDPEDREALFENIMHLYRSSKEELKIMGERSLAFKKENYDPESCIDELLDIIF